MGHGRTPVPIDPDVDFEIEIESITEIYIPDQWVGEEASSSEPIDNREPKPTPPTEARFVQSRSLRVRVRLGSWIGLLVTIWSADWWR